MLVGLADAEEPVTTVPWTRAQIQRQRDWRAKEVNAAGQCLGSTLAMSTEA
jgi:hypothetical protein